MVEAANLQRCARFPNHPVAATIIMRWTVNSASSLSSFSGSLEPQRVLYRYDGPILFTSRMGVFDVLCYKIEETETADYFLVCLAQGDVIAALVAGTVSLRAALDADSYWIAETQDRLQVSRTWKVDHDDLTEDLLPQPGAGLVPGSTGLPDTFIQANAFFSVRFTGSSFKRHKVSFRLFKELTDLVYETAKQVLTPVSLAGRRSSAFFDMPLSEPRFASLLIAIGEPKIDAQRARRRISMVGGDLSEDYLSTTRDNRQKFFASVESLAAEAQQQQVSGAFVADHFYTLQAIAELLPSDKSQFETTEFSAAGGGDRRAVIIDKPTGQRLRQAFKEAATREVRLRGLVQLMNAPSNTFVIQDVASGRQVTCNLTQDWFRALQASGNLQLGAKIVVVGHLQKRPQRDALHVTALPELSGN